MREPLRLNDEPRTELSAAEAAPLMGVSQATLTRWCRAGCVPGARKVGKNWRIPAAVSTEVTS